MQKGIVSFCKKYMKCPKCGKGLIIRDEKVTSSPEGAPVFNEYAVCMDCHKKWNLDKIRAKQVKTKETPFTQVNTLPPESIRQEREMEMKKNYTALLNSGRDNFDNDFSDSDTEDEDSVFNDVYEDDEDDYDSPSKVPVVILSIIIILALICAGTLFYCKKTDRPIPFIGNSAVESEATVSSNDLVINEKF